MFSGAFGVRRNGFQQYYRAYPIDALKGPQRPSLNYGGKIILPQSALQKLTMLHVSYPMLFEVKNAEKDSRTHAGVLEFTAEEGRVYIPQWMMDSLALSNGALLQITNVTMPLGSFVKFEPQSVDFLDISDPKSVLENALRNFSALSINDVFTMNYNDHIYAIKVLEVKPESKFQGISIVETDLNVDFAPPVGYVEPGRPAPAPVALEDQWKHGTMAKEINYKQLILPPITSGNKVNGKTIHEPEDTRSGLEVYTNLAAPPLDLPWNQLYFGFPYLDINKPQEIKSQYVGEGNKLRQSKKRKDLT